MTADLRAPFPYFGGKSRIAGMVWERFGQVQNYVEPFFGSGAVLLGCPWPGHTETVNDVDALLANFWRALAADPAAVAAAADWPVNEVDLHARHKFLRDRRAWVEELMTDPSAYDAQLAGWWVWGISQWIGSGWCPPPRVPDVRKLPHVGDAGMGVHRARPSTDLPRKRPVVAGTGARTHKGLGVHRASLHDHKQTTKDGEVWNKRPQLSDDRGVHRETLSRQLPHLDGGENGNGGRGITADRVAETPGALYAYFDALAARLRRVRVCCGDWRRVTGPSVTFRHGLTAVLLDPPYAQDGRADVYAYESRIFDDVRQWAIEQGDNPLMRVALCGYDFTMPDGWQLVRWKAHGGYGSQGEGQGRANAHREIVAFSPHCLNPAELARDAMTRPIAVRAADWTGTLFDESEAA